MFTTEFKVKAKKKNNVRHVVEPQKCCFSLEDKQRVDLCYNNRFVFT